MADEFSIDINAALERAKTDDLSGAFTDVKPDGLQSVRKSVENCEQLSGLDKKVMQALLNGEWNQYITLNSSKRQSKKIVIEYDIKTI